jgi:hypothetical protein
MPPDVPQQPPLEIVKQGRVWLVEEYRRGARDGETYSTHDEQIDAVRSAKSRMDADRHPCAVRWDGPRSVSEVYWNPLFECLVVGYDDLVGAWTVVPEAGTCAMAVHDSREAAGKRGKQLQRAYDFKHLHAYDRRGESYEERDHRFLRHDVTRSGVRFSKEAIESVPPPERDDDPEETEAETTSDATEVDYVGPASPGQLGASIPDVTKVEFIDTDGVVHRYATPWDGGSYAEILAVSSKHGADEGVQPAFSERLSRWEDTDDHAHVATVHESGTAPTPWVAYRVGKHTLGEIGTDLPVEVRLDVLGDVVDAVTAVADPSLPVCGLYPANVHLKGGDSGWRATVSNWGIEWAVREALGVDHGSPFTAPEQLEGRLTRTTAVYQLGAIAYWLLCETTPVEETATGSRATMRTGQLRTPEPVDEVSQAVEPVLRRALAPDPDDRYGSPIAFYRDLTGSV